MKANSNKISINSQVYQHLSSNRGSRNNSKSSNHDKNSEKSPTNLAKSNSHQKISRMETNQSQHSPSNHNIKARNIGKRFKTEEKSHQFSNNSQRKLIKKQASSTKRLRTDVTERLDSPKIQQHRFEDDHQNPASLAELLQFHTGYHDMDQQEFNYRVRKETEGSKLDVERKESSGRTNSVVEIQVQDNQKTVEDEDEEEEKVEEQEQGEKVIKESNEKSSNPRKSRKSLNENRVSSAEEDEDVPQIESDYTLGLVTTENVKKPEPNFKKKHPKIRSYSHEDKLKIISESKYVPKSEQQMRMEVRYLKGQLETIKELREVQQMGQLMTEYKNNKRKIIQQSAKKIQINKLMQNMKAINKKSVSLPKIKTYEQIVLPLPQCTDNQKNQESPKDRKSKLGENSLSATRFHPLKKDKSLKNVKSKEHLHTEIENVEYIESVLRSKGVQFDINAVRKGLMSLRVVTDLDTERIEYPRNLISNPKYQKYPL